MKLRMRVFVLVLSAVCACRSNVDAPMPPAQEKPAASQWVRVLSATEQGAFEAPARVLADPSARALVSAPLPARVVRIAVKQGQTVAAGDVLADVAMPEAAAAAAALTASSMKFAAFERRRQQLQALAKEGMARAGDMVDADVALAVAGGEREAALAILRAAGIAPAQAAATSASGGRAALRSPIAGVVSRIDAVIGELRPSGGAPLFEIVSAQARRIEARLLAPLPAGATFAFITGSATVNVTLVATSPSVDETDRSTPAWFEAPADAGLTAHTLGKLVVRLPDTAGLVTVPAEALGRYQGGMAVTQRQGQSALVVPVEVLSTSNKQALVRGALKVADEVAVPFQHAAAPPKATP